MKKLVYLILLLPKFVFGADASDSLSPTSEVFNTSPGWESTEFPVNNLLPPIHDEDTTTYIFEADGGQCRFAMSDPTDMGGVEGDSLVIHVIAETSNDGGSDRIRIRLFNGNETEYCDGSNITLDGPFTEYTETFTATPANGQPPGCDSTLNEADIDGIVIGLLDIQGDENRVAELWAVIWWQEASDIKGRRRRLLGEKPKGGYEIFGDYCGFNTARTYGIVICKWMGVNEVWRLPSEAML